VGLIQNAFIRIQKNSHKLLIKDQIVEEIIIYYPQKAEMSDDVDVHLLKYCYRQIMPQLVCLDKHIFCLPTTSDYTAEDFINPVKSLFGCADAEKCFLMNELLSTKSIHQLMAT
jgi:hypothetical protein